MVKVWVVISRPTFPPAEAIKALIEGFLQCSDGDEENKINIKDDAWLLGFMSFWLLLEQFVLLFPVVSAHHRWRHSCWPALNSLSENTSAHRIPAIHHCQTLLTGCVWSQHSLSEWGCGGSEVWNISIILLQKSDFKSNGCQFIFITSLHGHQISYL